MPTFVSVVDCLQQRAGLTPDQPAFIFRDPRGGRSVLSWQMLYKLAGSFAWRLKAKSVGGGDLEVNTLPNSPERVVTDTGILLAGAASVNCQCQLGDGSDLLHVLCVSRATAVVLDPDIPNGPLATLRKKVTANSDGSVLSEELPDLKTIFFVGRGEHEDADFMKQLEVSKDWYKADDIIPENVCVVFTTSGTTGFSKLVVYTHGCLADYLKLLNPQTQADPKLEFNMAPLGWVNGFIGTVFASGNPRVLCDVRSGGAPDNVVDFVWSCVQEEKPSKLATVPVVLMPLAERVRRQREEKVAQTGTSQNLPPWQWEPDFIGLGGQPLTRSMIRAARSISKSVLVGYGATDFLVVSICAVSDADTFVDYDSGPLLPGFDAKIVSQEDERISLSVGQTGNILIKHPYMMKEYLNNPEATKAAFTSKGYFRTGDTGHLDSKGRLYVDGRGCDAIMRGAYIFYPGWLKARIRSCPGVMDVVVVGVPDPDLNEELCACVVPDPGHVTTEDVREFLGKEIVTSDDDPLSPRPRHYLMFDSFPLTPTDKPRRQSIKETAAARLMAFTDNDDKGC